LTLSDAAKWTGCVFSTNGKIYGMSRGSSDILIIDKDVNPVPKASLKRVISAHYNKL
jgi:hypothetical protein